MIILECSVYGSNDDTGIDIQIDLYIIIILESTLNMICNK